MATIPIYAAFLSPVPIIPLASQAELGLNESLRVASPSQINYKTHTSGQSSRRALPAPRPVETIAFSSEVSHSWNVTTAISDIGLNNLELCRFAFGRSSRVQFARFQNPVFPRRTLRTLLRSSTFRATRRSFLRLLSEFDSAVLGSESSHGEDSYVVVSTAEQYSPEHEGAEHSKDDESKKTILKKVASAIEKVERLEDSPLELAQNEDPTIRNIAGGLVAFLAVGVLSVSIAAAQNQDKLHELMFLLNERIQSLGPWGYVAFAVTYILLEIVAMPATPFTLSSGFLFGVIPGTIVISISSTIAAAVSFLLGRYVARDYVVGLAKRYKKFQAIDAAVGKEGFKIVFLLRLSPLLPFSLSNYLYGLTAVNFWSYVLASWLGMLPGTLGLVYAGQVGRVLAQGGSPSENVLLGNPAFVALATASTIGVVWFITKIAKDALEKNYDLEADKDSPPVH